MTQEQIIESNKLIAEFMGVEFNTNGDKCNHPLFAAPWFPIACLKYHISWDWLMPVVEKLEQLGYEMVIEKMPLSPEHRAYLNQRGSNFLNGSRNESKLLAVHNTVTEFITWHNESK